MKVTWYLLAAIAVIVSGCDPEKPEGGSAKVITAFSLKYGDQPFATEQVFVDDFGYRIRVDDFLSYFSTISLVRPDGTEEVMKDIVLADFGSSFQLTDYVPDGSYTALRMYIGIPEAYNKDVDPTIYPNSHPLSVQGSQGMFWGWNTGYIFVKFDGKADLDGVEGNPLLDPFAFHCGDDPLLRALEFPLDNTQFGKDEVVTLNVVLDVEKILTPDTDPIDISVDYLTHTAGNFELAERFMDHYAGAFILEQ